MIYINLFALQCYRYCHGGYFKYYNDWPGPTSLVHTGELIENKLTLTYNDHTWFDRELKGIGMLSDKEYLPNVLDVNVSKLSITVEHGINLNHALYEKLKLCSLLNIIQCLNFPLF